MDIESNDGLATTGAGNDAAGAVRLVKTSAFGSEIVKAVETLKSRREKDIAAAIEAGGGACADKSLKKMRAQAMGAKLERALASLDPAATREALEGGALSVPDTGHGRFKKWLDAAAMHEADGSAENEEASQDKMRRLFDCLKILDKARCPLFVRNNQHLWDIGRSMEAGGQKLASGRLLALKDWLAEGDSYPKAARGALCRLVLFWSTDKDQESRVGRNEWIAEIQKKCSGSFDLASSMLAPTIQVAGWDLDAQMWSKIAEAAVERPALQRGPGAEGFLASALALTSAEIEKIAADKLMCRALWADNLSLMSAVAKAAPGLGASVGAGAAKQLGLARREGERPRTIPWIHAAIWAGRMRMLMPVHYAQEAERGACLAALSTVPGLLAEARQRPCPEAFGSLDRKSIFEIWDKNPEWLGPDSTGRTLFHVFAESASMLPAGRGWKDLLKLLDAGMWGLAQSKNADGQSGLELLKARLSPSEKNLNDLRAGAAKWEAGEIGVMLAESESDSRPDGAAPTRRKSI